MIGIVLYKYLTIFDKCIIARLTTKEGWCGGGGVRWGRWVGGVGVGGTPSWRVSRYAPRFCPQFPHLDDLFTGELAVCTDLRSVSNEPSRMFSVLTEEGCHVGSSREFVGTVYCAYGQSNTTSIGTQPDKNYRYIFEALQGTRRADKRNHYFSTIMA